jgi:hypothetical protein
VTEERNLSLDLVHRIGSPFRVSRDRGERPRERFDDHCDQLGELATEGRGLPAASVGRHVKAPQVDRVAAEAEVLRRVVGRARLNDERDAVLPSSQVLAGVAVQQGGDLRRVMGFGGGRHG